MSRVAPARASALLAILLSLFTTGLVTSGSAVAASGDYGKVTTTAAQRSCSDARCPTRATIGAGSWVQTWCWRDGGSYNGTPRWFRVRFSGRDGWVSASQMNPQPSVPYCSELKPDEALYGNESVWSGNGSYRLVMQTDGNLVEYGPSGALWASSTSGAGAWAIMQSDGNLVVYSSGGAPLWATGTAFGGAQLAVQSDSNVVMYTGSAARWASGWHRQLGGATRTWNAGASGNCTWYAYDRWHSFWNRHQYPAFTGDASNWANSARQTGWQVFTTPVTQALVVFPGTSSNPAGHVAWVDAMRPTSTGGIEIHAVEMNHLGLGVVDNRWLTASSGLSYIPAPAI